MLIFVSRLIHKQILSRNLEFKNKLNYEQKLED